MFGKTATYMIVENGAGVVKEVLTPGKMTIFPTGSLHTMMNIGKQAFLLCITLHTSVAQCLDLVADWPFVSKKLHARLPQRKQLHG